MRPVLRLGPLAIRLPGSLTLLGLWLASLIVGRHAVEPSLDGNVSDHPLLLPLVAGRLTARLGNVQKDAAIYLKIR